MEPCALPVPSRLLHSLPAARHRPPLRLGILCNGGICAHPSRRRYPGDKPKYIMYAATGQLRVDVDTCAPLDALIDSNYAQTSIDSASGQSGSAVWDSDGVVRGILVANRAESATSAAATFIRPITQRVYEYYAPFIALGL